MVKNGWNYASLLLALHGLDRVKCTFTVTSVDLWYSAEVRCVVREIVEEEREVWFSELCSWRRTATVRRII